MCCIIFCITVCIVQVPLIDIRFESNNALKALIATCRPIWTGLAHSSGQRHLILSDRLVDVLTNWKSQACLHIGCCFLSIISKMTHERRHRRLHLQQGIPELKDPPQAKVQWIS